MIHLPDDPLVTAAWLARHVDAPDLRVLDVTLYLPGDPRNAQAQFAERRIPRAAFFDIDAISDHASPLPHMLPTPAQFAAHVRPLGLSETSRIVVYDNQGQFSAARAWWMFRAMGHDSIAVLDGGFPAWERGGHAIETGPPQAPAPRDFHPHARPGLISDLPQTRRALANGQPVLDARSGARFRGDAPEPRPGLRSGHMPGAHNIPFSDLLTADGLMKSPGALREVFAAAHVDPARPAICTCGSGVTAAIIALALARLGQWECSLYDGSWAEWGGRTDTDIATGAA